MIDGDDAAMSLLVLIECVDQAGSASAYSAVNSADALLNIVAAAVVVTEPALDCVVCR